MGRFGQVWARFRRNLPEPAQVPRLPEPDQTCPNLPIRNPQLRQNATPESWSGAALVCLLWTVTPLK